MIYLNLFCVFVQTFYEYTPEDSYMSFLPLPHMYEKIHQAVLFTHGCRIGYFRGDVRLLLDDIQTLKPTIMSMVPRLLNKIFDKVQN